MQSTFEFSVHLMFAVPLLAALRVQFKEFGMKILTLLALILSALQGTPAPKERSPQKEEPKTRTFLEYRNTADGISFKMENGRIELTVPADKGKGGHEEFTTYKASGLDEFKRLYPDIARKYDVEQYLPKAARPEAVEKWWEEWSNRLGGEDLRRFRRYLGDLPREAPDAFCNLDRWFDEEHQILRDLERRLHEEGAPAARESSKTHSSLLGILVSPLSDPLRTQLGLPSHAGLLVADVEKGSLAEASGLKKYDVLVKLSAQAVEDTGRFKEQMTIALQSKEFTLDVIRGGSPMKLTIHPAHS